MIIDRIGVIIIVCNPLKWWCLSSGSGRHCHCGGRIHIQPMRGRHFPPKSRFDLPPKRNTLSRSPSQIFSLQEPICRNWYLNLLSPRLQIDHDKNNTTPQSNPIRLHMHHAKTKIVVSSCFLCANDESDDIIHFACVIGY